MKTKLEKIIPGSQDDLPPRQQKMNLHEFLKSANLEDELPRLLQAAYDLGRDDERRQQSYRNLIEWITGADKPKGPPQKSVYVEARARMFATGETWENVFIDLWKNKRGELGELGKLPEWQARKKFREAITAPTKKSKRKNL